MTSRASVETGHARRGIMVITGLFIILGIMASVINPLHEATDELRHYRFVRHIVQHRSLPVQGAVGCSAQGHHPPLFYTMAAVATAWIETGRDVCYAPPTNPFWNYRYWEVGRDNKNQYLHGPDEAFPWHGEALAAHIARVLNVLLGAGTVWLTWLIGRAIWPDRPYLGLGGAAFVAFNPMFVYMAGAINNDVLAALSGTAVTLACVRLVRDDKGLSRRWGLVLGSLLGLALMSKFNLAAVVVLIETAVLVVAWRQKQWRLWLEVHLLIGVMAVLLAGWWFGRNQVLYGEPTGFQRLTELWGVRDPAESWGVAIFELSYAWTSLWGRFGYGQIPLPEGIYTTLRWVVGLALAGLLLPLLRRQQEETAVLMPLLLLLLDVILFFGVLFNYLLVSPAGPMGRFFFPALPALSLLSFYGLSRWVALLRAGPRWGYALAWVVNGGMAGLTLVSLVGYVGPAYARPDDFAADAVLPHPSEAQFDSLVRLQGYDLKTTQVRAGEAIDIALYWEVTGQPPGNYLLFVHLIDKVGTLIAQRDTHPGLGNFPSSQWQVGQRFVESIRLYVPETAYTPAEATLSIGLYAPGEGYRLGITDGDGASLGDALTLATVMIEPGEEGVDLPNPLDQNFNNALRLQGYAYSGRTVAVGEPLQVTLYWQALAAITADYIVQVHLLDEQGQVVQTADSRPQNGTLPTDQLSPGQLVIDEHQLFIGPEITPGIYVIDVALLDAETKDLQNIVAADGHWIDNHLSLAKVVVQEPFN